MKHIFLCLSFLLLILSGYSQKSIQIKDQYIEIRAVQNKEPMKMEFTDFVINIDYETGEFLANVELENPDLFQEEKEDRIPGGEFIEITGIIPIQEILFDQSSDRSFDHELTISYTENEAMILFKFNMMDIPTSQNNAKIFQVHGTLDLTDFKIDDLKEYDPEILLYFEFHTHMIGG